MVITIVISYINILPRDAMHCVAYAHGRNPRGDRGDDPPQKILDGGPHSPYPPNKLSAQLRKITICLDTMTQVRLNAVAVCHIHQHLLDSVNDERIVQSFVHGKVRVARANFWKVGLI